MCARRAGRPGGSAVLNGLAPTTLARHSVLVIGAGLAGLTSAIELVDAGLDVTLVERRPFAGGRTFSFNGPSGDQCDNGQHVFLGCCSAYLALLDKLGQRGNVSLQDR